MSKEYPGVIFLLVGPSGVGKSVILNLIKQNYPQFIYPITATTRPPRPTEKNGVHYHFLTPTEFKQKIQQGEFLEYANVHGNNYYGVLASSVLPPLRQGQILLREVDIQGVLSIQKILPPSSVVSIFLLPPSRKVLAKRIRARAPISDTDLAARFTSLEHEVTLANHCTRRIKFGDEETIEENYQKVEKVILEELQKRNLTP